uniref:Ovule protein n=1 Tax=Nippostrongylus brasiliensis TaxID=27835 RepID=A0A0N4XSU5_NIPBR
LTKKFHLQFIHFQIPIQKKSRKSKTSTRQSSRQKTDDSKRERDRSKTTQKEACKCQQIRDDPKLKTKACTIL